MTPFAQAMTVLCAIGAGTAAGTFFTFSTFTVAGLKRLEPAQGAAAMQAINREAPTPAFMLLLFGTGVACLVLMVYAALHFQDPGAGYQLVAGALYLVGVVALTVGYHVPRNNLLDELDPNSAEGTAYWGVYLEEWVNRAFHQAGSPPDGMLTFGIPDPDAGDLGWCGTTVTGSAQLQSPRRLRWHQPCRFLRLHDVLHQGPAAGTAADPGYRSG